MLGSASSSSYEPYTWGIPSCAAAALPFSRLRDAMAINWMYLPFCMAGITLLMPILAVLSTPQRTLFITLFLSGMKNPRSISEEQKTPAFRLRSHYTIQESISIYSARSQAHFTTIDATIYRWDHTVISKGATSACQKHLPG